MSGADILSLRAFLICLVLASCAPDYSPNTYSSQSVQQAAKTEQGVVVGVRDVDVRSSGQTGAVTGGAVGAITGSQLPGSSATTALGSVGGTLLGSVIGSSMERAAYDTRAYEYVVRTSKGELVSVTQKDEKPLALLQHVLVIAGPQARIVADYTVALPEPVKPEPVKPEPVKPEPVKPEPAKIEPAKTEFPAVEPAKPALPRTDAPSGPPSIE